MSEKKTITQPHDPKMLDKILRMKPRQIEGYQESSARRWTGEGWFKKSRKSEKQSH